MSETIMAGPSIFNITAQLRWNPNRPFWPQRRLLPNIDKVVLHQGISSQDVTGNADVFGINNYHISPDCHVSPGKGAPHICYHYAIDDDGKIYQVNDLGDVVWHCLGNNTNSIGILLVGDFDGPQHTGRHVPSEGQERSFFWLAEYLLSRDELPLINDNKCFYGHCDLQTGKVNCPGTVAYEWVQRVRKS